MQKMNVVTVWCVDIFVGFLLVFLVGVYVYWFCVVVFGVADDVERERK